MPSELFHLAAAISRAQARQPAPNRPVYDNSTCCTRCGRQVRMASYTPMTGEQLNSYLCVICCSGRAA